MTEYSFNFGVATSAKTRHNRKKTLLKLHVEQGSVKHRKWE